MTSIERSYKTCLVFSGLYFFPLFYGSSSSYVGVEVRIASSLFDLINNCTVDATFWLSAILPSALITFRRTALHRLSYAVIAIATLLCMALIKLNIENLR